MAADFSQYWLRYSWLVSKARNFTNRRICTCIPTMLPGVELEEFKGLASYCKAESTFTFHFSILTLSNAFLGIDNREMKSESGFSFAIASQPFQHTHLWAHDPRSAYNGSTSSEKCTSAKTWTLLANNAPKHRNPRDDGCNAHLCRIVIFYMLHFTPCWSNSALWSTAQ